jgi:hypothetical protein
MRLALRLLESFQLALLRTGTLEIRRLGSSEAEIRPEELEEFS